MLPKRTMQHYVYIMLTINTAVLVLHLVDDMAACPANNFQTLCRMQLEKYLLLFVFDSSVIWPGSHLETIKCSRSFFGADSAPISGGVRGKRPERRDACAPLSLRERWREKKGERSGPTIRKWQWTRQLLRPAFHLHLAKRDCNFEMALIYFFPPSRVARGSIDA